MADEDHDPDIVLAGFRLWVTELAYPRADNPFDRDQIRCRAMVVAPGSRVELPGDIGASAIYRFMLDLQQVYDELDGEAQLDLTDVGGVLTVRHLSLGHLAVEVSLSPDYGVTQKHWVAFEIDQTDLVPVLHQCSETLVRFPVEPFWRERVEEVSGRGQSAKE